MFNDLNISLRHDLISLAGRFISRPEGRREISALYDTNGRRVDDTNAVLTSPGHPKFPKQYRYAPERIDIPAELNVVGEEVLYLGVAHSHYGHFVVESMARFWAALETQLPCVFLGVKEVIEHQHNYYCAIMNSMSFTVVSPDGPTLYRKIWVPDPTLILDEIHPDADVAHLRVTEKLHQQSTEEWDQPVFLSRRGLPSRETNEVEEARLEDLMELAGYQIVRPQNLRFADQIALFNECPKIVGLLGSAFHTAFFSRRSYRGNLALLTFPADNTRYHLIDSIKAYSADYMECSAFDMPTKTMSIDVKKAKEGLTARGFI